MNLTNNALFDDALPAANPCFKQQPILSPAPGLRVIFTSVDQHGQYKGSLPGVVLQQSQEAGFIPNGDADASLVLLDDGRKLWAFPGELEPESELAATRSI